MTPKLAQLALLSVSAVLLFFALIGYSPAACESAAVVLLVTLLAVWIFDAYRAHGRAA